jgi:hypothetical protein
LIAGQSVRCNKIQTDWEVLSLIHLHVSCSYFLLSYSSRGGRKIFQYQSEREGSHSCASGKFLSHAMDIII